MRKAASGAGTIRQLTNGRWEGRATIGCNPGTGKPTRRSVYGATQAQAQAKLIELTASIANGTYKEPSSLTVRKWLEVWSSEYLINVKPSTALLYKDTVNKRIIPALGAILLHELKPHDVQRLINSLVKSVAVNTKKPLNAKTIKNIIGVLHRALSDAERNGYVTRNVASKAALPRIVEKEIKPLDAPEIVQFLDGIRGNELETLFITALFTGMRSGELCGLTWPAIDFEKGTIRIFQQLSPPRQKGKPYFLTSPKNGKGRTIAPAPTVMNALKNQKRLQAMARITAGAAWDDTYPNLCFTLSDGTHLTQAGVCKRFATILKHSGIEKRPFHSLRHTYCTSALRSGIDVKTIQVTAGHYSAAFTIDKYMSVTESMWQESAAKMEIFIKSMGS